VGNKKIRPTELKEQLSLKEKEVFVDSKMLVDERTLRDYYLSKGYTNANVVASSEKTSKGVEVLFKVDEGYTTVISNITFEGNSVVNEKTLRKKLSLKEYGFFSKSKSAFTESSLEKDKLTLQAYYQDRGYADFQILDVTRNTEYNPETERNEMTIHYVLQEGSPYSFAGIKFDGNKIFPTEQLSKLIKLKDGDIYNQTKFQEGIMAIADLYYENGYTNNGFQPVPEKNSEKKEISYTLYIQENARSHIENVIIKGNTKTKDSVIRREIPIESGDIFSKAKVMTGLRNLYNLQYFSAVVPEILPGSEDDLVDLIVSVEEQSTTSVEFGVTFSGVSDSDDLPISLFVKWTDSNLGGLGKSLSVESTLSTTEKTIGMSYSESYFMGLPINMSLSGEYSYSDLVTLRDYVGSDGTENRDYYYMNYQRQQVSLGFSLGHRWTPDFAILSLAGGVTGSLIDNMYDDSVYTPIDSTVSEYHDTWRPLNNVWTSFSIDDRDINYDPSTGWFLSQKVAWYGLIPAIENKFFLRTDTKAEAYLTLFDVPVTETWDFKAVIAAYSGLSMLFPTADTVLGNSNKLYINGYLDGRGWSISSIRGRALWSNRLELRVPVVPHMISLDGWADAAAVMNDVDDLGSLTIEDFYFSYGPGIRFTIPQFPLRLLWANTFRISDDEIVYKNKWKFVLSFNITNK
nr:outer membrane protein assembly factor BamA [Treponema sp.]